MQVLCKHLFLQERIVKFVYCIYWDFLFNAVILPGLSIDKRKRGDTSKLLFSKEIIGK